jgi:hypothetical protein
MTQFEFQKICVQNLVSPLLVWELDAFKELVKNNRLTNKNLINVIKENF